MQELSEIDRSRFEPFMVFRTLFDLCRDGFREGSKDERTDFETVEQAVSSA